MRKIHLKYCREVIFMVVAILCSIGSIYAQVGQTVSGVVKDVAGEPLIGVSVLEVAHQMVLLQIWMENIR